MHLDVDTLRQRRDDGVSFQKIADEFKTSLSHVYRFALENGIHEKYNYDKTIFYTKTKDKKAVIRQMLDDGKNYNEIAQSVGLSRERIRQIANGFGIKGVLARN